MKAHMSGNALAALIVGSGVASSAAIAYTLSRRDDEALAKLRRDLEAARERSRDMAKEAELNMNSVRRNMADAASERGLIERRVESSLRTVRDDALAAIKAADRALDMARVSATERASMSAEVAAHTASIRSELDRLARQASTAEIVQASNAAALAALPRIGALADMNKMQIASSEADAVLTKKSESKSGTLREAAAGLVGALVKAKKTKKTKKKSSEPKPSSGTEFGGKLSNANFEWQDRKKTAPTDKSLVTTALRFRAREDMGVIRRLPLCCSV